VRDALGDVGVRQPNDEDGTGLLDRAQRRELREHACPLWAEKDLLDGLLHAL
jgi:hypothetical protein